ncbi:MAG: winged helix-turn-helix domain-containing protein [Candidatus Acidiferrum sp.]
MLRVGAWHVNTATGEISRNGENARVEARTMRVLLCLAQRAGEVVSIEELLDQVWSDVSVSPDSVYQAVTSLRRVLGDDPKQPTYIATVPRLGYRMVAAVSPWVRESVIQAGTQIASAHASGGESATRTNANPQKKSGSRFKAGFLWAAGAVVSLALVVGFLFYRAARFRSKPASNDRAGLSTIPAQPEKSIAVLPFLDLTEGMTHETFADGMTEELIDKFSKIQGLRVPSPTSSFYFKGKQIPVAEIAKTLGVIYVLDGSVRKSGTWLRVDVRLIRADNGYIVWSQTYDRPFKDILMIQDDIAGEVTKALRASIEAQPD